MIDMSPNQYVILKFGFILKYLLFHLTSGLVVSFSGFFSPVTLPLKVMSANLKFIPSEEKKSYSLEHKIKTNKNDNCFVGRIPSRGVR